MTTYGFTGTHLGMTEPQELVFRRLLPRAAPGEEFHHGDCVGSDAQAHQIALEHGFLLVIHPPDDPSRRAFCQVRYKVHDPKPFMRRNEDIVVEASELWATPHRPEAALPRSGTWATVRRARKKGIHITIIWPDGSVTREGSKWR